MSDNGKKCGPEVATDLELANAIAQKSEGAFEELRRRYAALVRSVVGRVLKTRCPYDHREDTESEVWKRLWQYARPFDVDRGGTVEAFIAQVARNQALSHRLRCLRDRQREAGIDEQELAVVESAKRAKEWGRTYNSDRLFTASDLIDRALSELDDTRLAVINLGVGDGVTYGAIAKRMGLSLSNVKIIMYRFRKRCKELSEENK